MPLDVTMMARDTMSVSSLRMADTDPYYAMISAGWGNALRDALDALPDPELPAQG